MSLDRLAKAAYDNASNKGFHDGMDFQNIQWQLSKIALITSEASEVLEALRKEQGERKVVEEIADILIRTLDFYQCLLESNVVSSSLDEVYDEKANKNKARPRMHGVLA
jgi:NTP pyrophosphatase (non-canonical NTP hydrolase)